MSDLDLNMELGPQFTIEVKRDAANVEDGMLEVELQPAQQEMTLEVGSRVGTISDYRGTGAADNNVTVTVTLAQPVGIYYGVTYQGVIVDPTDISSLSKYAGLMPKSGIVGEQVNVVRTGLLKDSNWTWTPNQPLFISPTGIITQVVPTGVIRRIGWAITPNEISLDLYPIIGV